MQVHFSLSRRKRKQSDLLRLSLYLERCVYDLCSNGILSDTMGAGDMPRLPTDDAGSNKQKQSNFFFSPTLSITIITLST